MYRTKLIIKWKKLKIHITLHLNRKSLGLVLVKGILNIWCCRSKRRFKSMANRLCVDNLDQFIKEFRHLTTHVTYRLIEPHGGVFLMSCRER